MLLDLERGFRDYEVFREYLTNKDKVEKKSKVSNVKVNPYNFSFKANLGVIKERLDDDISYVPLDDEESDYEPDDFAFLTEEEREEAYGEGNIDIEEHRRRINGK